MTPAAPTSEVAASVDLVVEGMTCAACARRVERSLTGGPGAASAHVNFATGVARVEHDGSVAVDELVGRIERAGYGAHEAHQAGSSAAAGDHGHHDVGPLRTRFRVALVLTLPILAAMLVPALRVDGWELAAVALGAPVALWAALPFHRAALRGARHGAATMDTLISIGILAAWGWSLAAVMAGIDESYVEVAAVTTTLVLGGRVAEAGARRRAGDALRSLLELSARDVTVVDADGTERALPADQLAAGDRFIVRPGERIATDGVVDHGEAAIDRSVVTGESVPEPVTVGDDVLGGTTNVDGRLVVRATRVGTATMLAQVARLVEDAQAGRAQVQRLADQVSGVFVPIVLALSALTLAGWLMFSDAGSAHAVAAAVAVLIVACPCALGLATPTALLVGSGRGAQLGIVIRGPEVLEQARRIDTVVLDKTGTVTSGRFRVADVLAAPGIEAPTALAIAAALEQGSEHPLATAIVVAAREHGAIPSVDGFRNHAGRGVSGKVDGSAAVVGRSTLLDELGIDIGDDLAAADGRAHELGATVAYVAWDGAARAALLLRDEPREDTAAAIGALRDLGLRVLLATGDGPAAATAAATLAGITADEVHAGLLPADKAQLVEQLRSAGHRVAMVGDGVNDAPALAAADLGIAIGTGADVAIEASDLTLVSPSLWSAVDAIRLSRATLRRIRVNLFWAFAYNVAALPLAMSGKLEPMVAGGAMAASSLFVVGGSLALRRFQPAPRD
ncbi:MAG: heavy metal translocating P-type ATPase [Thermoleophilia bacterium]|nr:heavy metal translocating P-type ATPase [Thermoleophilia bacterium]